MAATFVSAPPPSRLPFLLRKSNLEISHRNKHPFSSFNFNPEFSFQTLKHLDLLPRKFTLLAPTAIKTTSDGDLTAAEEKKMDVYNTFDPPEPELAKHEHKSEETTLSTTSSSSMDPAAYFSLISPRELEKEKSEGADSVEVAMVRRLFRRPTTKGAFDRLKSELTPALLDRLTELLAMDQTVEVGLEIADSVYILNLLGSSSSIDKFFIMGGKKAGKGAMLLMEGARLLTHGQVLMGSAVADMSQDLVN